MAGADTRGRRAFLQRTRAAFRIIGLSLVMLAGAGLPGGGQPGEPEVDPQVIAAMQAALDAWESACRRHLRIAVEPLPWIIFFDESHAWHVNPERNLLPPHEAVVASLRFAGRVRPLVRLKNQGRLWVPGRDPLPLTPRAVAMPYAEDRKTFCIIALPSFWRKLSDDIPAAVADDLFFGAACHELTHTRQLVDVARRINRLRAKHRLPESIDDNLIQRTFAANAEYKRLYEEERGHLTRAILADNLDTCRQAVAQVLSVSQKRKKRFFVADKKGYSEIEDLMLVLEGVAMWVQYQTARDRAPMGQDWRQTLISLAQQSDSWSQEAGLGLFLLIDRLVPGWQARFLAPNFPSPFAVLREALRKPGALKSAVRPPLP